MDFILMDIKNFLKKLENGQLEIEAGQWELHKDITNMRKMVSELKSLKEELGKMRMSSQQQMGLIKDLQDKFGLLQKMESEDPSINNSGMESDNLFRNRADPDGVEEMLDNQNCSLLQSDDILEIGSRGSRKVKSEFCRMDSELGMLDGRGMEDEDVEFTMEGLENSMSEGSRNVYMCKPRNITKPRKGPMKASEERLSSPQYITSSTNQDILHRYLQDSAKYLGQKQSGSIEFEPSITTIDDQEFSNEGSPSIDCEGCSSVLPADSENEYQDSKTKMSSLWKRKPGRMSSGPSRSSKKYSQKGFNRSPAKRRMSEGPVFCRTCGKNFTNMSRLKKHAITHWMAAAANGKGFKCSYCKKSCPTPETLTQHLRKCRVINQTYNKMKA